MARAKPICSLDDIQLDENNIGQAAIETKINMKKTFLMALRKGNDVFLYKNSCPHLGSPLDFETGKFLNPDKTHIICSTHGALFEIENGDCIHGPCIGDKLEPIPCRVEGGMVWLD
ncbi:MAG: Rieske (2Fe-2S) protein [Rhodospirillaceae bacterium]|nr:Rieske (2Fe-2S) protein [Rhodospirillaceae bacterium]